MKMGDVVCIAGQRSESGKTATAVNLAVGLSLLEKSVLLMDADPREIASRNLGIPFPSPKKRRARSGLKPRDIAESIFKTDIDLLHVLPAAVWNLQYPNEPEETTLQAVIRSLKSRYACIFIDTPAASHPYTICALAAADYVMLPVKCTPSALEDIRQTLVLIRRVRQKWNPGLRLAGIVFTFCHEDMPLIRDLPPKSLMRLRKTIFGTVIPAASILEQTALAGKPVALMDVMSEAAGAYMNLVLELQSILDPQPKFPNKGRLP